MAGDKACFILLGQQRWWYQSGCIIIKTLTLTTQHYLWNVQIAAVLNIICASNPKYDTLTRTISILSLKKNKNDG